MRLILTTPLRSPWAARGRALVLLGLLLPGLHIACAGTAGNANATAAVRGPTTTQTPLGELLRIEGRIVTMVVVLDDGSEALYAATDAGLHLRESGRWEPTGTDHDERWLLVDSRQPERLFRGDHPPCWGDRANELIGLESSWDSGRNWLQLPQGRNVRPLALDPDLSEVIYGSDCRLAISTTSGHTWTHYDPLPGFAVIDAAIYRDQLLVLVSSATGASRLISVDVSDPTAPEYGEELLEVDSIACLDIQHGRIVIGGADTIYISDDGGASWAESNLGLEEVTARIMVQPRRLSTAGVIDPFDIQVVRIAPHDKHRLYAGTFYGLFLSQDDGATWLRYDAIPPTPVRDIQLALNDADLYVTTDVGVVVVPAP